MASADTEYGTVPPRKGSQHGSRVVLKRLSESGSGGTSFERPISSVPSLRSIASQGSVRTRRSHISRSEYHSDIKVSLKSGLTSNLVFATFIIVLGSSFLFGWNIGCLNNLSEEIKTFYNETYYERNGELSEGTLILTWSLTTALFFPGGMAGAFLGGFLADRFGRKKTLLFALIFAVSGAGFSTACVAAKSPELLMIGRILFGIHSGLGNCIAPMYLSEIAPYNLRGAFGTIHQLAITIGIFVSSIFGLESLLGSQENWPYLILLEVIPSAMMLIILPFLPESPRFLLLTKGDRKEAEKSLQFYRKVKDVTLDMEEMDTEANMTASSKDKPSFSCMQLLGKDLRKPLFIACALQFVQQFSGINAIFFYSSSIFKGARIPVSQIPFAVIGTNCVNVLMTVISVPVMDIAGRRLLLLLPMVIMAFDFLLLTICLVFEASVPALSYVSIGCIVLYVISFAVGLGPIPMMIGAELFRQEPRAYAMATAGVFNLVFTFIIAVSFESVQVLLEDYTFLVFFVLMILFVVFVYFFVPETKGKTIEEIAHMFSPGTDIEVEELEDVFDEPILEEDEENEDWSKKPVAFRLQSIDEPEEATNLLTNGTK